MSHIKITLPGAYDFGEPNAQVIKMATAGLRGNDLAVFIKRAGYEMADVMHKLSFYPGEIPIHTIAIGATEYYGPNRNFDGFTEACCRMYHNTFVKHARWYRNHQNKDPKKSYGIIKHSTYNEAMHRLELIIALNGTKEAAKRNGGLVADKELEKLASGKNDWGVSMACARLGTLVKLKRGFRPVEQIQIGDEVLTHKGRYRPVYASLRRTKQTYVSINTKYYGRQALEFTPDHEFYVARWEDIPHQQTASERSWWYKKQYRDVLSQYARWLPCGELRPGDFLLMPIERGDGSSTISTEEARLLGYYLAEGSIHDGYPCFTVNKKDDFVNEVRNLVGQDVSMRFYDHSASTKAYNVNVFSKQLGTFFAAHVGCGVRNKVIPRVIINAPRDTKLAFIGAWFNGDGWQDGKGLHWSTCSRTLSLELQNLLASIDIPATVCKIVHTTDLPDRPRTVPGVEYVVNVSNRFSAFFINTCKASLVEVDGVKTTTFITGDYLAIPVKGITTHQEDIDVCDISVVEDASFTAFGIAVHNCKVAYDVCSACGNRARTKAEYCTEDTCPGGGCQFNLGKVAEDGSITFVDNPHPTWFDLSDVYRGADRIAFVMGQMQKAASHGFSSAELVDQLGITAPFELELTDITDRKVREQLKLAHALATIETEMLLTGHIKTALFVPVVRTQLHDLTDAGRDAHNRPLMLKALANEKISMSLTDFIQFASGQTRKQAEAIAQKIQPNLHGLFGRMCDDVEKLAKDLAQNPFRPSDSEPSSRWQAWAEKQSKYASLDKKCIRQQAWAHAIRDESISLDLQKQAMVASDSHEGLARAYGLYKLAFLYEICDKDPDFDLTSSLVVRQNYVS